MHPRRRPGGPRVDILLARDVSDDAIVELARDATVTGIDSPFGWPRPFTDAIAAYAAGAAWPRQKPDGLWFRLTDLRARPSPADGLHCRCQAAGSPGQPSGPRGSSSCSARATVPRGATVPMALSRSTRPGPCGAGASRSMATSAPTGQRCARGSPTRSWSSSSSRCHLSIETSFIATDHAIDALVASLVARAFGLQRVVAPTANE